MAQYSSGYLQSHCVDVFFRLRGKAVHVLTDGCGIPEALNDLEKNRKLQQQCAIGGTQVEGRISEVTINHSYLELLRRDARENEYELPAEHDLLAMFAAMAALGFYTYDCIVSDEHSAEFRLVAKPLNGNRVEMDLPNYDRVDRIEEIEDGIIESFIWYY